MLGLTLAGALGVQTLLLREIREHLRGLADGPQRTLGPVVVSVPPPREAGAESVDGWTVEHRCFRGEDVFVTGSWQDCEAATPADSGARRSWPCAWRFSEAAGSDEPFDDFLRNPQYEGALGMIVIFGGHDSRRVRRSAGQSLDSNFDLAHRRAVTIANALRENEDVRRRPWALLPLAGSYPPPCGDEDGITNAPDLERRRPLLSVTLWRPAT